MAAMAAGAFAAPVPLWPGFTVAHPPPPPDLVRPIAQRTSSTRCTRRLEPSDARRVQRLFPSAGEDRPSLGLSRQLPTAARPRRWTVPTPSVPYAAAGRSNDGPRDATRNGGSAPRPRSRSPLPRSRSPVPRRGATRTPTPDGAPGAGAGPDGATGERKEWDEAPGAAPPASPPPRGVGGGEQTRFEKVVDELVQIACNARGSEVDSDRLDAALRVAPNDAAGDILPSYALSKAVHILSHELCEPERAEALIMASERRGVAIRGAVLAPLVKLRVSRGERSRWEALLHYYFRVRPPGDTPDERLKSALAAGYAMYDELDLARAVLLPDFGRDGPPTRAAGEAAAARRGGEAALCWAMLHAAANLLELALAARYGSADGLPGALEGGGTGEAAAAACKAAIDAICGRFEQNGALWARLRPNMVRDWSRRTFDKRIRGDLLEEALDVLLPGFARLGRADDLVITAVQAACARGEAERAESIAARLVPDVVKALPRGRRGEGDGDAVWEVALALASAHAREGGSPARARSLLVGLARASRSEADARVCTGFVDEALVQSGLGGAALAEIFRSLARPARGPVDPSTFALRWANRLLDDHAGLAARGRSDAHRRRRLAAAVDAIRAGPGGPTQALDFALAAEAANAPGGSEIPGGAGEGEGGEDDEARLAARVAEVVRVVDECVPLIRRDKVGGLARARAAALLLVSPATHADSAAVRSLVGPIRPPEPRGRRTRRGRRRNPRSKSPEQPFELSGRLPVLDLLDSIREFHAREGAPAPFDRYKLLTKAAAALGDAGLAGDVVRTLAEAAALGLDELFAVASVPVLWSSAGDRTSAWSGVKAAETVFDERAGRLQQWRNGLCPPPAFLPAARPPSPEAEGGLLGGGGRGFGPAQPSADDVDSKNLHFMYATTAFWLVRRCGAEGAAAADALLGRALRRGARVEPWTVNALARAYRALGRPSAAERVQSAYTSFGGGGGGGAGGGGGWKGADAALRSL